MSATVALTWRSRARPQTSWLARSRSRWASGCGSSAACASAWASSTKSTVCQGVSVPPQSKMTASTAMSAPHGLEQVRHHVLTAYVGPLARGAVLHLEHTVGDSAAGHDDRGHPDQLGVLELHARADPRPVVEEHGEPLGGQLGRELLGGLEHRGVLACGDQVDVGGRDLAG